MIAVVFGGKSVEHDISIITGLQTLRILKKNYKCLPIYVDKKMRWWTASNLNSVSVFKDFEKLAKKKRRIYAVFGEGLYVKNKKIDISSVFLCLHGINGEDGSFSAIFEQLNIPYTSSNLLSSALTMDKCQTKTVLKGEGIETAKSVTLSRGENIKVDGLNFPMIVKPAKLGSSIGIGLAKNLNELKRACDEAFAFDDKVLVEEFLTGANEFNCAAFMFDGKIYLSNVYHVKKDEIFSFEDKYMSVQKASKRIDKNLKANIQNLTKKVYKLFDCFGIVRVDFLCKDDKLYVNEINSIPGALGVYLFNQSAGEIFDLVLSESKKRQEAQNSKNFEFESNVLDVFEKLDAKMVYKK